MKTIDLSHLLNKNTPVYPGTEPPSFEVACTLEKDGFEERLLNLYSHTGTHMDAPSHMIANAPSLQALDISHFLGKALVLDVSHFTTVPKDFLLSLKEDIQNVDFVLFYTAWSKYWGTESYFQNFPVLENEAAHFLSKQNLKGVGFDAISADGVESTSFDNHMAFFKAKMVIIENLTNLEQLLNKEVEFFAFPLNIEHADGSPIRAVAKVLT